MINNIQFLFTDNGDKLYRKEEILEYLKETKEMLRIIRKTPKFAKEFKEGNLTNYYNLENSLKLSTPENKKLNFDEVYEWLENNKIR